MKKLMVLALLCSGSVFADRLEPSTQPITDVSQFTSFLSNDAKMKTILEEVKCLDISGDELNRKKIMKEVNFSMTLNEGMMHVGQTLEGDVISFEKIDDKNVYTLYYCERPSLSKNVDSIIMRNPVLNVSPFCSVAEVSAADLLVSEKSSAPYQLAFYPLGLSEESSLCIKGSEISDAQAMDVYRNLVKEGLVPAANSNDSDASQVSSGAVKVD